MSTPKTAPLARPDASDGPRGPEEEIRELEKRVAELDTRNLALEKLASRRGVKLSCANIALSRAKIAFDQASKRREEMVQEVAHDLRTPLTSIKGAAQNLLDGIAGELTPDASEYVEIVRDQAERLIGITSWLVEAIHVSAEPIELNAREVDIAEMIADVVRVFGPIADERGIEMSAELCHATAFVDLEKVRQVIENLVGNALKFTSIGGQVRVETELQPETVAIRISDTGRGMSPEDLERVFDRYYRGSYDSIGDQPGTGLGLAIAREMVRMHGGEISAKSTLGQGSELTVCLPRHERFISTLPPSGS